VERCRQLTNHWPPSLCDAADDDYLYAGEDGFSILYAFLVVT